MRSTFLQGEILLEQLCWVLSLLQEKLCGLSCFGTFLGATDTAGTFALNAEHMAKLAHKAHAHQPSSVDARLDLGASSVMYQEATYQERNIQEQGPFTLWFYHVLSPDSCGSFWHLSTQEGFAPGDSLFWGMT